MIVFSRLIHGNAYGFSKILNRESVNLNSYKYKFLPGGLFLLSLKKAVWILCSVFLLSFCILLGGIFHFKHYVQSPASLFPNTVIFPVPKGATFKTVTARLVSAGIITHPLYFELLARMAKKRGLLKAGEYSLDTGMTPVRILEILTEGRSIQFPLTVPEGFSLGDIAVRLEKVGMGSADEFLKVVRNRKQLDRYGISSDSFEGYLFPDTYLFERGTTEAEIMERMADYFVRKVKTEEILREVEESGLTFHEVVTLASLIEKETAVAREKNLVSGVFHNRLKRGMLLQCDPTVIYAMKNFDGNIRKKDLKIDSPYNTYRTKGLPPGPIANSGFDSIKAALNPAKNSFLYFVSKKDGSHHFSKSLREHNQAVRKYQLNRRR